LVHVLECTSLRWRSACKTGGKYLKSGTIVSGCSVRQLAVAFPWRTFWTEEASIWTLDVFARMIDDDFAMLEFLFRISCNIFKAGV
jgi:hypothetical protein